MLAETPPFTMPMSMSPSLPSPGQAQDIHMMAGLSYSPGRAASMDTSENTYFPHAMAAAQMNGIGEGKGRSPSSIATRSLPRNAFEGPSYQFPDPFAAGQWASLNHPAYQAGLSMGGRLSPGFSGMSGGLHHRVMHAANMDMSQYGGTDSLTGVPGCKFISPGSGFGF